jgi:hypothetical protein
MVGGHDDVAGERELEAAAQGVAVDPRDDRLAEAEPFGEPGPVPAAAGSRTS